jgi:hypothetical protein
MAVIKKYGEVLDQPLSNYQTFVTDTNPLSEYFRITEFKDTFTGGKNGFLIEGSKDLLESTEIKIQILDVEGNSVYWEPGNGIPEYYEGLSKVVSVYVYEDTPIGIGSITILGELKTYTNELGDTVEIPTEWQGIYNVKWNRSFQINRLLSNEDKVRFYRRPQVGITEIVKPIFNNVVTTIIQTGSVTGIAQSPRLDQQLAGYSAPTSYLLTINDNSNWTGSVVGTYINMPSIGYTTLADGVINNKELLVQNPYTVNGLVDNFANVGYTASFNYVEGVNNLKTALTGSFAKIRLTDLTTFVGDVARVRIFRKSQSDLSDYQFVQEIKLESNELLVDLESYAKNQEYYGIFDNSNYITYWTGSSTNLTTEFNQTYLFNSVKINSNGVNQYHTSKSISITENAEYTLDFNLRISDVTSGNYIKAFLSGSRETLVNGSPKTIQIQQNIVNVNSNNSLLQKTALTTNFKGEKIDNPKLYFEVKGNNWYLSDVSLRASQETSFSPNEITFIQSVPRSLPEETFLYRFEFYDINNNSIPVNVEATKTFDGGNLQRIQKGLVFTPRSLGFQFDSGSNPVPPTVVGFTVTKNLLTGSVHYTSQSFDFDGNELFRDDYTASITLGGGYPGLLDGITSDTPTMTVQHFTGSRTDKTIQLVKITGEVEGYTDSVIFSRVLDGFGGVNYLIRPYRGTQIRNSSTASLEVQAIRIDGVNDIELSSLTYPTKGWPDKQLHVLSGSYSGSTPVLYEKFITLAAASSSGFIKGLTTGSLGTGEINYNATFNRDSIDFRRTVYLMSAQTAASDWAYVTSGSVLASQILEDLQDGLDSGVVIFNADSFTINPRTEKTFTPITGSATASFAKRGTAASDIEAVTASFQIYPSMSINKDWVPEYWMYYHTQSLNPTITVVAKDDNKKIIPSQKPEGNESQYVRSPLSQSKNLTVTFTYTEPWTSASVSIDKTFTIVPEGKQGDESIVFEVSPASITMPADSRGFVKDYKTTVTQIKLKQGSKYLAFSSSAGQNKLESHGQFHIAQASIISTNITGGLVYYDNRYTESLIISASSDFTNLSASLQFPLIIHPYYTSSIYTASVVQNFTKVLDGPPPIQIIISPTTTAVKADEVGYVTSENYTGANTTLQVKEGDDFLTFTTQSTLPGTWRINLVETLNSTGIRNIRTGSLSSSSLSTATLNFNRFDYPHVSSSVNYTIQVYPFALGAGFRYTSSIYNRTQTITKNVSTPNARSVDFKASSYTINYNRDGNRIAPLENIDLTVTAFNTTGSYILNQTSGSQAYLYYVENDGSETFYDGPQPMEGVPPAYAFTGISGPDAAGPGENKTWKVKITDGKAPAFNLLQPADIRAEGQLTIAGVKAGNDAYKLVASNESTSITANLWTSSLDGTGMKITTFKGTTQLINVDAYPPYDGQTDVDYQSLPIGVLGYSSASIFSKSSWITPASTKFPTSNPASIGDISDWTAPGTNTTGEIVYKVDFENNQTYGRTQTQFVTQSFAVQFTNPAPYTVNLTNENSSAVYKVSGQFTTAGTGTSIRAYRGEVELSNTSSLLGNSKVDAYGVVGYPSRCRVSVLSKSPWLTLGGGLVPGSFVTGNPATIPAIAAWSSPETNTIGQVVYQIDCEYTGSNNNIPRQTLYKTQSISIQQEGSTGPGIVMRGEWSNLTDYSGSVETQNKRRDAVIYGTSPTTYYAAVSGSGPTTYDRNNVFVAAHAPTAGTDNAWWQYLGEEEFFVAAKIAIFEESYVKNTINVGNNPGSAYANIVLAGGRNDPYMAIGQYATIGYGNQGIWQGIYDLGGGSYMPRMSMVNSDNSRYLKWTGTGLEIRGDITVTGGDAATQGYANNAASTAYNNAVASANGYTGTVVDLLSGSLGAIAAIDSINAGQATTYIGPGAIVTSLVATNLITSLNYSASIEAGSYSDTGTFIDLSNGSIKAPGFSIQANGNASFKGFLSSSNAVFGGWKLDATTLASQNGRISFDANKESITVLDTSNNPRFIANTSDTLPSPSANAPSPASGNGSGFSFDIHSINNIAPYENVSDSALYPLLNFTAAAGGGNHLITYTYNPTSLYSSYVYANGAAYASLGITLVVTDSAGANVQYGTGRYFYADGDFVDQCGGGTGGGYYPIPSVIGTTEIILKDGSIKLAKDIVKGEEILSWDEINNKFTIGKINDIRGRQVDLVYKVVVGGEEVKVSDSHKFWTDGDGEILVTNLVAGVSKIYVKVNNSIELKLVDDVNIVYEKDEVFTFSVKDYHNYISNNIISHNSPSYCYYLSSQTAYVSKPSTFTITTGNLTDGGSYKVQLYISRTAAAADTSAYTTYDDSEARVVFAEQNGAITLKRISAGTIANGGGFQAVSSDTQYLRHMTTPTETNISTYIKGGLQVDKIYGFYDTLDNASPTPSTFTNIGYNVAGYAMIKGYGRWSSNVSQTGTVTIPYPSSMGGCITSLVQVAQGSYNVSYSLAKNDATLSTIVPSIFFTGTRDMSSIYECTISIGKYNGDSTYTNFKTQDNNTDGLYNMDEISLLVVM